MNTETGNPLPPDLATRLIDGCAIPAHPLALDDNGKLDERCQRALCRYYIDAGAGGVAVGVHSTQFSIRDPDKGLFAPVLQLAAETARDWGRKRNREMIMVSGVCGETGQAVKEAELAREQGYHAVLLSLAVPARTSPPQALVEHCRRVAEILPLFGFYLQTSVGGCVLPYDFWRSFLEIENTVAIKIAPFNRYRTLDVVRALADAGREKNVALYTGNDDNILIDLLTPFPVRTSNGTVTVRMAGGLLGQWAVWTSRAVELLDRVKDLRICDSPVSPDLLAHAPEITDANAAIFDVANDFAGCIPGIQEILRRQGLLKSNRCLDPRERLSPGQAEELDRVCSSYPHLTDDSFVREHLDEWMGD